LKDLPKRRYNSKTQHNTQQQHSIFNEPAGMEAELPDWVPQETGGTRVKVIFL
jgi:hypothetical protein